MSIRRRCRCASAILPLERLESRVLMADVISTLGPVADAYVRDGASAAVNFGADPLLMVKGSTTLGNTRRTYLKFDLASLSGDIDAVTLRLFGSAAAATPSVQLAAFGVPGTTWAENTINWNNKPALAPSSESTRTISGTTDQWYEWDVTNYVRSEFVAGRTTVALAVNPTTSSTSNPTSEFDAREGANDPELVVTTSTDPDPDPDPEPTAAVRIDAAGGPTTDSAGNVWAADAGFVGGSPNTKLFAVAGTTDDALYATRRTGTFSYANTVPNGDYTLNLLFADYYGPGQRRFNVSVEGQQVLTNFDISAEAGVNTALVKSFPVTISDGKLDMGFVSVTGFASLSAFELLTTDGEPPPPPPVLPTLSINDVSANEGNSGQSPLTFTVTRAGDTSGASTVNWSTQNGTAGEGDYAVAGGTITFAAGQTSRTISVNIKGDNKVESNEHFFLNLGGANGATIADGQGQGTIVNDDGQPGTNVGDITWTRNAPRSPLARTEAGVVQIGSKIYAIGGFGGGVATGTFFPITRRVHVYDMVARSWSELASLPDEAAANHSGVATDGTYIYVVAGQITHTYGIGTNTAWRYHIASNTWSQFVSLPEVRYAGVAFIANGFLHFVGGDQADRETPTTDHWAIDLSDTAAGWQDREPIPLPGDHMSHATINGKVYVFGGEHGHHGLGEGDDNGYIQHNYTFEYNPATDTWTRKADMPLALSHVEGSTLVINGKAVLIGGVLTGNDPNITNRVHVYDPVANSWRTLSTRFPKRINGAEAGYWNGKIYMTDGYSPDEDDRQVGFEGTIVWT